jgi:hypothetical protein
MFVLILHCDRVAAAFLPSVNLRSAPANSYGIDRTRRVSIDIMLPPRELTTIQ